MKTRKFLVVPMVLLAAACANTGAGYRPVVDGPVSANYEYDLQQCQRLASTQPIVNGNSGMAAGATAGAAAAGTAILNNKGHNVRDAAIVGGLVGLGASAMQNNTNRESVVANCMRGRGYRVVG